MKKLSIVLPPQMRERKPAAVLGSAEKVREATRSLQEATKPHFEKFRISRQKSLEEANKRFLD
jgi:hypothetical protein